MGCIPDDPDKHPAYYAHSASEDRKQWHLLSEHLDATASRAAEFLGKVGLADFGRVAGLLHDIGKYNPDFQARLLGSSRRVDHAAPGAWLAKNCYSDARGKILAFCIAGHHTGLANGVNGERITALADRLKQKVTSPDPIWKQEIKLPASLAQPRLMPRNQSEVGFCAAFLIRMLFSALVDADYLDTEAYYSKQDQTKLARGEHPSLKNLSQRLNEYLDRLQSQARRSPVNALRREVLEHVRSKANESPGLFTLTVPTGGGKTLTSLAFALDHAVRHGLERIIYVIPYMSIIEQTAETFREALSVGDCDPQDFLIEHHSTFDEDQISDRESKEKLRLAMENWDAPIIVTTAVQFFESLFANRPSRCRKLHNIANSVIILDEAQTLPLKHLRPCIAALDELAHNWRSSVVLCTATQPALFESQGFEGGFERKRELAPEPQNLYQRLKRTNTCHVGRVDDGELAGRIRESSQILCIVNSRRHAYELFEQIADTEGAFHLTTLMCARHRRERLDAVRCQLRNGAPVRLIATSLVEAGVDLDFPVVWRAEAGLESIIQAAGRCNREGKADTGSVFVFEPEGHEPPAEIAQFADAARSTIRRFPNDPASLDAIQAYFQELYWSKGQQALDSERILLDLAVRQRSLDFPFETIAKKFRLIDDSQVPVVVPWRGQHDTDQTSTRLLAELEHVPHPGAMARRLQPYLVQIPPFKRKDLLAAGSVSVIREKEFGHQFVVLSNLDLYRADTGLMLTDPRYRSIEGLVL